MQRGGWAPAPGRTDVGWFGTCRDRGDPQVSLPACALSLGRLLEDRKSGPVVLTATSSAVHQPWKAAAKTPFPPRGFPGAGESATLSVVHSLHPFLSFPIQELSLVPFSTNAGERGSSFCPLQPVQAETWVGCWFPARPLPPVSPCPSFTNRLPPATNSCCSCPAAHLDFNHSPDKNCGAGEDS